MRSIDPSSNVIKRLKLGEHELDRTRLWEDVKITTIVRRPNVKDEHLKRRERKKVD